MSLDQANRVLSLYRTMIQRLSRTDSNAKAVTANDHNQSLDLVSNISHEDLSEIWKWNASVPASVGICVHDLITEVVKSQPRADVVSAWDGKWTYSELDTMSTLLARYLVEIGVGTGVIVPLCFEKGKWMSVAMLAVMKAGGASVALDHSQPEDRLRLILDQVHPIAVLSSSANFKLISRLTQQNVFIVDQDSLLKIGQMSIEVSLPLVSPSSALYVVFTSGSTGTPKGVIVTHSNYSAAIKHQQRLHGFVPNCRVFDFATYAFDVAWNNFLQTLTCGGCLCVPSEFERKNDIAGSIIRYNVTYADMTPSIASIVPTQTLSRLHTLVLGGEALRPEDAKRWAAIVPNVVNPYGPSECTSTSTLAKVEANVPFTGNIGKGAGVCTWVVDSATGTSLVPIGCVGELVMEGPLIGAGYFNDVEKTKSVFVEDPSWLLRGSPGSGQAGRSGRVYFTGDLVRYNPDGSLSFIGRKDAQVKINGQRVELGEIEHHIQKAIAVAGQSEVPVVVEQLKPRGGSRPLLVAILGVGGITDRALTEADLRMYLSKITTGLDGRLTTVLPPYMIPAVYFPVQNFPSTVTGKTDRRKLRLMAEQLTVEQLQTFGSSKAEHRLPKGQLEYKLREAWAQVLKLDPNTIGADDSFLRLGGDSISAMNLVGQARSAGLSLTIADVLKHPTLSNMARATLSAQGQRDMGHLPYQILSLLPANLPRSDLSALLGKWGIKMDVVQDILPTTDEQARYVAMTYSAARGLLLYHTLDGEGIADVHKVQDACAELIARFDMLRTVFIAYKDSFLQVILKEVESNILVLEVQDENLDDCTGQLVRDDTIKNIHPGAPLVQFTLIWSGERYRLIMRISHAQHDGMSLAKLWTAFEEAYQGRSHPIHDKSSFALHMNLLNSCDRPEALKYWRALMRDSIPMTLKHRTTYMLNYDEGPFITSTIKRCHLQYNDFTFFTVLKAAWAYVLARNFANPDVVFGYLTNGRGHSSSQDVFGPCVQVLPARINMKDNWRARDLLTAVHEQGIASMPFESLGSRTIIRECTQWPNWHYFNSVVRHNNFDDEQTEHHERRTHSGDALDSAVPDLDNVEVHIVSAPAGDDVSLSMGFAANVVPDRIAHKLAAELHDTILQFYKDADMPLAPPREIRSFLPTLPTAAESSNNKTRFMLEPAAYGEDYSTMTREALKSAWQDVLGLDNIPADERLATFFNLGGDLIGASSLSAAMERQGYKLSVEDVIANPQFNAQLQVLSRTCVYSELAHQKHHGWASSGWGKMWYFLSNLLCQPLALDK
jgi:amino acid adenylation domain-containing protein